MITDERMLAIREYLKDADSYILVVESDDKVHVLVNGNSGSLKKLLIALFSAPSMRDTIISVFGVMLEAFKRWFDDVAPIVKDEATS